MTKTQARTSTLSKEMSAILLTLGLWWVKPFISFSVKQFVRTEEALQKRWPPQGIKKRGATNLSFELNVKGCVGRRWQQPFWAHSSQKKEGCKCTVNEIVHTMRHCKRMSRMKLMEITYFLRTTLLIADGYQNHYYRVLCIIFIKFNMWIVGVLLAKLL